MHFLNLLLHIDLHLRSIVAAYGLMVYVLLFVLVATPFVSGDALLFAGGTLAGMGMLDYPLLCAVLLCATVIGDSAGFFLGGLPFMQKDLSLLVFLVVCVAAFPLIVEAGKRILR